MSGQAIDPTLLVVLIAIWLACGLAAFVMAWRRVHREHTFGFCFDDIVPALLGFVVFTGLGAVSLLIETIDYERRPRGEKPQDEHPAP